jgi:ribonuclease BN (tRNA processing enzyme)
MRATILGSGTCVPSLKRSACAVLVETGDAKILMDVGPGTIRQLLQIGVTIFDITHVLLSHFHPDHSGELVPLLFSNKYPNSHRRVQPMVLIGGSGLIEFFSGLESVYGEWIRLPSSLFQAISLESICGEALRYKGFQINSIPVMHRPESLAYRITDSFGKTIVYSGDTDVSENLVAIARLADVFICESAFPDEMKKAGHLTPSEAGRIATEAGVRKLVLTHFYPECDMTDMMGQCRKTFKGDLVIAEDLMSILVDSV